MQRYQLNANGPERPQVLANALAFLQRLPESKSWRIEIKEARRERTLSQCNALFGVAYPPLVDATGYTADELHEAFCRKFFGTVGIDVMGECVTRARRTTTTNEHGERDVIDRATFAEFYDLVQRIGAECGVDVPSPDPLWWRNAA
jgi:hypothetical protein